MGTVTVLERPVYGMSQAAGLLGMRSDRVRAWLDGYGRAGTFYPPVIRPDHTGDDIVTWGEFIELGYLREYRHAGVSLQSLRPVIARLREEYLTPYPLATAKLYVHGKELVASLQDEFGLPPNIFMVVRTGAIGFELSPNAEAFFRKVEFASSKEGGGALRWLPAGPTSPVIVDPRVSYGMPTVNGSSTERLFEVWTAEGGVDATTRWLARTYGMDDATLRAALSFEEHQRSVAA